MHKTKFLISLALALTILVSQAGTAFAAPAFQQDESSQITGTVQSITLESDPNTGTTTVLVTLIDGKAFHTVRVSLETAITLGLVTLDGDGNPLLNQSVLGDFIEIDPAAMIAQEVEYRHPVGSALAAFFSDILGVDYDSIMAMHDEGFGFGVIAQTLWLTKKMDGDSEIFLALLEAKESGDFSAFVLEDGTTPKNWGQLKKALSDKGSLGVVMANKGNGNGQGNAGSNGNNGNANVHDNEKGKDKEKNNNGKGNNK